MRFATLCLGFLSTSWLSSCAAIEPATSATTSANALLSAAKLQQRSLVDHLHDLGLDQYIELPQIAVMGDTSSGKSSVLSAISGVTFPAASELTTRCPTQLILSPAPVFHGTVKLHRFAGGSSEHYAELGSMEDVASAIERLTTLLVNEGQNIADDQIVIEINGPGLPNLTLTDLPGLVRTVGDGEERSIIERVRTMVHRFMKQSRTIILAVVPANVDMHNTEILQAAQEADPNGTRTIAVVTKLDLVDPGAERTVHELLMNQKKHIRLGYHAVRCRNQKELSASMSIADGIAREGEFFSTHEYWHRLPKHLWGIPGLSDKLVEILHDTICRALPSVINEIDTRMLAAQEQLDLLGTPMEGTSARRAVFSQWVFNYIKLLEAARNGEYEVLPPQREINLRLGVRLPEIDAVFQDAVNTTKRAFLEPTTQIAVNTTSEAEDEEEEDEEGDAKDSTKQCAAEYALVKDAKRWKPCRVHERLENNVIVCSDVRRGERLDATQWRNHPRSHIRAAIDANRANELPLFPSYRIFKSLFGQCVNAWEQPALALVESYRSILQEISHELANRVFSNIPSVEQFVRDQAVVVLQQLQHQMKQEISFKLLKEVRRPFTLDEHFQLHREARKRQILTQQLEEILPTLLTPVLKAAYSNGNTAEWRIKETDALIRRLTRDLTIVGADAEAFEIETALETYTDLAATRFIDNVPMRTEKLLVQAFMERMNAALLSTTDQELEELLHEPSDIIMRREAAARELECLQRAKHEIENFKRRH